MSEIPKDIKDIFIAALEKEIPEERIRFLKETCGDDTQLRTQVEALLRSHAEAGDFLKGPAFGEEIIYDEAATIEIPGTAIGRYKLLEKIGEGGMAVVYMAQQEQPVQRKVALKIIKLGMDTKQVIARFEVERQALALMDHPNIAKVLDAGATETGRLYFVMDLVKGLPITGYCDENNLSTKERLKLFTAVCGAIQHAHQKGIIHRDIKPTNVLIQVKEGVPIPKVIDFGIAKAINQKLTERTLFTHFQQLVGTPEYMSPEQAEWGATDIDTRTDVYSLGVLLYELLTGTTPFDAQRLREAGYGRMLEIIRQEEPVKPSTKLSTVTETLTDIAAHRKSNPEGLKRLLHGDLDWIIMKALDKDRTRRYETAAEFGADINRHLANEPVAAAAPSTIYRVRKFVRRHTMGVIASILVVVVLLAGAVGTTIGFVRASIQKERAETNFQKAREAFDEMWRVSWSHLSGGTEQERFQTGLAMLEKAERLLQWFVQEGDDVPAIRQELGQTYRYKGELHLSLRNYEEAARTYAEAVNVFSRLMHDFPENEDVQNGLAYSKGGLGLALKGMGRNHEAEQADREAIALWKPGIDRFSFGTPVNLGQTINSQSGDSGPSLSSNCLSLFFHSNRPGGLGDYDLWCATRVTRQAEWSEPVNLGEAVNSPHYEGVPSISADRLSLFFVSSRPGGLGGEDLYVTTRKSLSAAWDTPVKLGETVNSADLDSAPSISSDGLTLYFESNRGGGWGGWDIWKTTRTAVSEPWQPPVNLGPSMNTEYLEQTPMISADGLVLFFSSNRPGGFGTVVDLWMATRSTVSEPFATPVPLGPPVNSAAGEACPCMSNDSSHLYFAARLRPGNVDGWDLWEVAIHPRETETMSTGDE